jgi:hypothetical protein
MKCGPYKRPGWVPDTSTISVEVNGCHPEVICHHGRELVSKLPRCGQRVIEAHDAPEQAVMLHFSSM